VSAAPSPARVLLVEDDAPIRTFVAMALEHHDIALVQTDSLCQARQALAQDAFAMVLLDLMLPDGSGIDLLRDTALRERTARTRWVVFSAGLTAAAQEQLAELGVCRVLRKPVALQTLIGCVDDMLGTGAAARPVLPDADIEADEAALAITDGTPQAEAAAVREYFEGRLELFAQVKTLAAQRIARDLADGEHALATADGAGLRRIAHNLKSVLRMLGRPGAAELAFALEVAAQGGRDDAWPTLWRALRASLERVRLA
jgi:DNA-binding response OmpR family regulator